MVGQTIQNHKALIESATGSNAFGIDLSLNVVLARQVALLTGGKMTQDGMGCTVDKIPNPEVCSYGVGVQIVPHQ